MNQTQYIDHLKQLHALVRKKSYVEACTYAQLIVESKQHYPKSIQEYAGQLLKKHTAADSATYHLSINPSYATEQEIKFWNIVHEKSLAIGASTIKELRFRKFPEHTLQQDSTVHPARLSDLFNGLHKKYRYPLSSIPSWLSADDVALHVDWEHRRWQIDKYEHKVEKGFIQLCWYIDSFVNNNECISVITSNKLDHPNRLSFLAAQRLGKHYSFVERSPFMGHLVEPRGMFGESKLGSFLVMGNTSLLDKKTKGEDSARAILNKNIYGFRPQVTHAVDDSIKKSPFVFFPLDNLIWTGWEPHGHPQGAIDYPNFSDINQLMELLSEYCEAHKLKLIVKPHPSCKEYPRLAKAFPSIRFETEQDLAGLIDQASIIVCGLTKVAFNAAALGKYVITVGENPANFLPNVHQCVDRTDLVDKMNSALRSKHTCNESELDSMLDRIQGYYRQTEENLYKLVSANHKQEASEPIKTSSSYHVKVKTSKPDLVARIKSCNQNQRIPVLFDISRSINVNLLHSGISKFTLILYRELCNISEIDVIPYINFLPKSRDGLSAVELHQTFDALSINFAYHPGKAQLESIDDRFIYLSPHWSLPPVSKQARRVITLHDVLHLTETFYEGTDVRKVTKEIIDSIHSTDRVVSVSQFSKDELQRIRPDLQDVSVVNLPPVLNRLVAGSRSDVRKSIRNLATKLRRMFILIPVQGDPRKRLDLMVKASSLAVSADSDLHCIFFGRAASKSMVKTTLEDTSLVLGRNCQFVELPTDAELHYLYQNALTTLYLSDSEGYGLPPLEALAAGCLPIARMNTGLSDSMKNYTHSLEESATMQDVCAKILEFKQYAPSRYREEIIHNQRTMVHQLTIRLGDEYYNVISEAWSYDGKNFNN
jgi:hypothetical protein